MNNLKLSILIPAYNCEKYISQCINSILKDNNTNNVEIIIINDGSTDKTLDIISKFNYDNIKIINQDNFGIAETRNRLLENVSGDFFWFIDSDDYIEKGSINKILSFLNENIDILELSFGIIKDEHKKKGKTFTGVFNTGECFVQNRNFDNTVWTKVIKTKLVRDSNIKFSQLFTGEDFLFSYQIISICRKIYCLEDICYWYRINDNSICSNRDIIHMKHLSDSTIKSLEIIKLFNNENNVSNNNPMMLWVNNYLSGYLYSLIRFKQYKLDYIEKVLVHLKAMRFFPINTNGLSLKLKIFNKLLSIKSLRIVCKYIFLLKHNIYD